MDTTIFIIKYQFLSHQKQKTWIPVLKFIAIFGNQDFRFLNLVKLWFLEMLRSNI